MQPNSVKRPLHSGDKMEIAISMTNFPVHVSRLGKNADKISSCTNVTKNNCRIIHALMEDEVHSTLIYSYIFI